MQVHFAHATRARIGPLDSTSGAPVDIAPAYGAHDAKQAVLGARQVPQRMRPPRDLRIEPGATIAQALQQHCKSRRGCRNIIMWGLACMRSSKDPLLRNTVIHAAVCKAISRRRIAALVAPPLAASN